MEECYPEVLYFYCNTEVFHNIIANKKLWLSDISKSNDALEQKYFAKLIIDNYDRIMCDIFNNHFDEREDDGVYEYLTKELVLDIVDHLAAKTWAMCFSEKADDLGQWRGYGDDGFGMCIGFDFNYLFTVRGVKLNNCNGSDNYDFISLEKIRYGIEGYEELLSHTKDLQFENMDVEKEELKSILTHNKARDFIDVVLNSTIFPIYKSKEFSEEAEWRIYYSSYIRKPVVDVNTINSISFGFSNNFIFDGIHYEAKRDRLVSHLELTIKHIQKAVREIYIGPKSRISKRDLMEFLTYFGFDEPITKEIVKKSALSYR
jgi:hypothetical protein